MARAENAECPKIGPPPALQSPSSRPPAGTLPHPRPPHLTQTLLTTDASMQSHRNQEMVVHCFLLSEEFVFGMIISTVKITFLQIDYINISPESTVQHRAVGTLISDTTLYPRQ